MADRMTNKDDHSKFLEEDISVHILSVSAAMVGVCLTVIGLLRVVIAIQKADTIADDLLALDAILGRAARLRKGSSDGGSVRRTRSSHPWSLRACPACQASTSTGLSAPPPATS